MAIKFGTSFPDNKEILVIGSLDSQTYYNFSIKVASDGKISVCGGGGTLLATTADPVLASGTIERNVSAGSTLTLYQTVNIVLLKDSTTRVYSPFVGSTEDPNMPIPPSPTPPTLE